MNRLKTKMGVCLLSATIVASCSPADAEWHRQDVDYGFSAIPNGGGLGKRPPADTVCGVTWQSIDAALKGDYARFSALYGGTSEQCAARLVTWSNRAATWEMEMPLSATNGTGEIAYVIVHSRRPFGTNATTSFAEALFLRKTDGRWLLTCKMIDPAEAQAALELVTGKYEGMSEQQMNEEFQEEVERWQEATHVGVSKEVGQWSVDASTERHRLQASGIRIPQTFPQMITVYGGQLYDPPLTFDAGAAPTQADYTSFLGAVRAAFHLMWRGGTREDIAPAWGTSVSDLDHIMGSSTKVASLLVFTLLKISGARQVHLLASVPVTLKGVPLRFVYYRVLDPIKNLNTQWIETGSAILKYVNDRWELTSGGVFYPGIITSWEHADGRELLYESYAGSQTKGADLVQLHALAGWPAPFNRLHAESECQQVP